MTDGLIQAPEGRGVFPGMTIIENLEMGCYGRKFASKAEHDERLDWVLETFPRLAERRSQVGGTLSGGEQQMLAIGRALMARPKVLLLDEPSMGLAPMVISQIFKIIAEINATGTTVLLVEQNAQQALSRSDRAYILETGEVTRDGRCSGAVGGRQHSRRVPRRRLNSSREVGLWEHPQTAFRTLRREPVTGSLARITTGAVAESSRHSAPLGLALSASMAARAVRFASPCRPVDLHRVPPYD